MELASEVTWWRKAAGKHYPGPGMWDVHSPLFGSLEQCLSWGQTFPRGHVTTSGISFIVMTWKMKCFTGSSKMLWEELLFPSSSSALIPSIRQRPGIIVVVMGHLAQSVKYVNLDLWVVGSSFTLGVEPTWKNSNRSSSNKIWLAFALRQQREKYSFCHNTWYILFLSLYFNSRTVNQVLVSGVQYNDSPLPYVTWCPSQVPS